MAPAEKLNPLGGCVISEVPYFGADSFPCQFIPEFPCFEPCTVCTTVGLKLDCPDCCIDSILLATDDECFSACGILQIPTRATWVSSPITRMEHCNSQKEMLTSDPDGPGPEPATPWCHGEMLAIKVCATGPAKIGYAAYGNCDGVPFIISHHFFVF